MLDRREFFKVVGGAALTLTSCEKKRDDIVKMEICNIEIEINLSKQKVFFENFNDQPIYVEIRDQAEHLLGYNILFSLNDTDQQAIKVDYGEVIFVTTYKIDPLKFTYELCEKRQIELPEEGEF